MEQRKEIRFRPDHNQDVTVNVLGLRPKQGIEAFIIDVSCNGLRLRSKQAIPCGAMIQVVLSDTLAYGSVNRCDPDADAYVLGVQISKTASVLKA